MSDVVKRLHDLAKRFGKCSDQETCIEAADKIKALEAENARLLANARQDAGYLAAYHYWCQQHGCAPSSSDLISARAALAEEEKS